MARAGAQELLWMKRASMVLCTFRRLPERLGEKPSFRMPHDEKEAGLAVDDEARNRAEALRERNAVQVFARRDHPRVFAAKQGGDVTAIGKSRQLDRMRVWDRPVRRPVSPFESLVFPETVDEEGTLGGAFGSAEDQHGTFTHPLIDDEAFDAAREPS